MQGAGKISGKLQPIFFSSVFITSIQNIFLYIPYSILNRIDYSYPTINKLVVD